ncbi:MAG: hypothetical protein ACXV3F_06305 [Frankiaceae bacterium]
MDVREKEGLSDLQVQRLSEYLTPAFTELRDAAPQSPATGHPGSAGATAAIAGFLRRESNAPAGARLWRAYASADARWPTAALHVEGERPLSRRERILTSPVVVAILVLCWVIGLYVLFRVKPEWREPALRGFAVVLLTLFPGFLFVRFIRFRLEPLRLEYVYNLHRLGVDRPGNLPEPPRSADAWRRWLADGGELTRPRDNIYCVKFATHYGRWPASPEEEHGTPAPSLVSIYLYMAVVGVGWAAAIWHWEVPPSTTPRLEDALRFGFLGAYFFTLGALVRRFFQNDLRVSAYVSALLRVIIVLILVAAVDQAWQAEGQDPDVPSAAANLAAFMIGVFPAVGLQLIRQALATTLKVIRISDSLEPSMPLRQIDGLDIWTETRLIEIGIEDVQHLASANIVEILLGTHIRAERIVDWMDQALLLVRAGQPRQDNLKDKSSLYSDLRGLGVRSATGLLTFAEQWHLLAGPEDWLGHSKQSAELRTALGGEQTLARVSVIATDLFNDPNLRLVLHWKFFDQDAAARNSKLPARLLATVMGPDVIRVGGPADLTTAGAR